MEDTAEFDEDFTRAPWLSAIQFLGAENAVVQSTLIRSIKKCLNAGKVVQVVAVIKSCTPNGLGGLMVLLKDPTGTVGASIHHKVLSESCYFCSCKVRTLSQYNAEEFGEELQGYFIIIEIN